MTLKFMSGWETQKNMDTGLWSMSSYGGSSGFTSAVRRGPSYAFNFAAANEWIRRVLPTSNDEIYAQVCFYWATTPSAGTILRFGKNANIYFTLALDSSQLINIYTGDGSTLRATGTTRFLPLRWYVIEFYFKRNASGTITVKVDGVSDCSWNGDTTLSISTVSAVTRMKLESGALGVDDIGTLPTWTTTGSPTASSTYKCQGSFSMLSPGSTSDYIYIADASLPSGYILKSGDTTQLGTFMYWYKATTVAPSGQYWKAFGKYDYNGNNVCFDHEVQNGRMRVNWCTGTTGHTLESTDTNTVVAGVWNHYSWTFDGPGKRWDMRIYDLHNASLGTYSRNCTNVMRTNCTAPYDFGNNSPGFYDDLLMFNVILPDWAQDCIRSIYHDRLLRGSDPYSTWQTNWMIELKSTTINTYVDDVIINDGAGSVNNSWIDRAHVILFKPISPGRVGNFTLSETSSNNGADFVKRVPASTMDFIYSNTAGASHSFRMYDAPLKTQEALGIMYSINAWRTSGATAGATIYLTCMAGNTTYTSTGIVPENTPLPEAFIYGAYTNPYPDLRYYIFEPETTNLFSVSDLNNLELGIKVS